MLKPGKYIGLTVRQPISVAPLIRRHQYFVDSVYGNDGYSGTQRSKPWQTLARVNAAAAEELVPTALVRLQRGQTWQERLTVPFSGAPGNPIRIGAYGSGSRPIIHPDDPDFCAIYVNAEDYITIQDLHIIAPYFGGGTGEGIRVTEADYTVLQDLTIETDQDENIKGIQLNESGNFTVQRCDISSLLYGVWVNTVPASVGNCLIAHNTIYDLYRGDATDWDGIKVTGGDWEGLVISWNDVSAFCEDGIDAYDASNLVIEFNYVHDGSVAKASNNQSGIKTGPSRSGQKIRYNICKNITDGTAVNYGIVVQGPNAELFNNVVYNTETGISLAHANADNCTAKNNIIAACTLRNMRASVGVAGADIDYNLYDDDTGAKFYWLGADFDYADWLTNSGQDANSPVVANPLFVNPGASDFHLQVGSPARNVGDDVGLAQDYDGVSVPQETNPAIGAYEYVA